MNEKEIKLNLNIDQGFAKISSNYNKLLLIFRCDNAIILEKEALVLWK